MSELVVLLDDQVAGTLVHLRGKHEFHYAEAYRGRLRPTPLSVSMPVQIRSHPDRVVTPWLWGLLPDNEAVLEKWARQFQVRATPFSLLGTPIGHDCAGAVRFAPADEVDTLLTRPGRVTWLTSLQVGRRLRDLEVDATAWLGASFTGQFSLAGAQAKTALLYQGGRWGEPSGKLATTHILKPAVARILDQHLNEHICLAAAQRVGLVVAKTRIRRFGKETAVVVERYDRVRIGRRLSRVHQEDIAQALSVPPWLKYQNAGGPGPRQIARLFREVMSPSNAEDSVRRFADALAWNWIIGGTDAHAKNYSLLLAGDEVRLAPLYDIASVLPYENERKVRFAMKLGSEYGVYLRRNPWPRVAVDLGMDSGAVMDRVLELVQRAPDAFADAARARDVVAVRRKLTRQLVDLVADRAHRCLQTLRIK